MDVEKGCYSPAMSDVSGAPHSGRPPTPRFLAAWLCAAGAAVLMVLIAVALVSGDAFGRGDASLSGSALAAVVVALLLVAAVATALAYAGHAVWRHGRRLPAGVLAGLALLLSVWGLAAEFAESGGGEQRSLLSWGALAAWAVAVLVSLTIPAPAASITTAATLPPPS